MGEVTALADIARRHYPANPRLEQLRRAHLEALRAGGRPLDGDTGTGQTGRVGLPQAMVDRTNEHLAMICASLRRLDLGATAARSRWQAAEIELRCEYEELVPQLEAVRRQARSLPETMLEDKIRILNAVHALDQAVNRLLDTIMSFGQEESTLRRRAAPTRAVENWRHELFRSIDGLISALTTVEVT